MLSKIFYKLTLAAVISLASLSAYAEYTFTLLDSLSGGSGTTANSINNSGQVVGLSFANGMSYSTLWIGTTAYGLGTLGDGTYMTVINSINDSGQIVGTSNNQATLWSNGTITNLNTTGAAMTAAFSINSSGQVVGETSVFSGSHATLWSNGNVTDLGTLVDGNYLASSAKSINNSGQVVGWSHSIDGQSIHAVMWNNGFISDLGTADGFSNSYASSINNLGQSVGYSYNYHGGTTHATLWSNGAVTDLGTLGGSMSQAYSINDLGQVVGYSTLAGDLGTYATLWEGSNAVDLNNFLSLDYKDAGWVLVSANGINYSGSIVGSASNGLLGITQAFLLTPVPEADTSAMLLMGAGVMGFIARRRKQVTA